jgi:hypothetical protein
VLDAEVPEFKLPTGRFPETSLARATVPTENTPEVALTTPVPVALLIDVPEVPLKRTISESTEVPGPTTSPPPAGLAQVPSPLQKVEPEAPVPLLRFPTGRFPVTWVVSPILPQLGAVPTPPEIRALPVATPAKAERAVVVEA